MKRLLVLMVLLAGFLEINAQKEKEVKFTDAFVITGEVKAPATIRLADLDKGKVKVIGDIAITNHLGETKSNAKGLKGVLLSEVLGSVVLTAETPKVLSEYYFVCKASDGYLVTFSWNEIFNTRVGETIFIVTEKDGKPAAGLSESVLLISIGDLRTGRRYVKGLASIDVRRAR